MLFSHRKLEVRSSHRSLRGFLPGRCISNRAGIGTELLADREKIEVTRGGSPSERSPVPMALRIAATRARFAYFPGECLKPETRWRSGVDSNSRFRLL
jgi:hypothetical protein